ncbi:MAG: hypothetical protein WC121_03890 [Candidatus Kapaibacterium sp.]
MKKIFFLAISLIAFSLTANALEPVGIVFPYTGETANITCELIDYGNEGGIEPIFTQELGELTPNSSGILYFMLGKDNENWSDITASSVSSYYVVNVKIGEDIKAQFRLDELINLSARIPASSSNALTDGEFTNAEELGELTNNIFVYTGEGDIDLDKNDLNENLPENATYMIVNKSADDADINFLFPPEVSVRIAPREYIILLNVGGNYYFAPQPGI